MPNFLLKKFLVQNIFCNFASSFVIYYIIMREINRATEPQNVQTT